MLIKVNTPAMLSAWAILAASVSAFAQGYELVETKSVSTYNNQSYYITQELNILPGFTFNAETQGEFYARPVTLESQAPSGGMNFVRTENMQVSGILTEAQISPLTVEQKSTSYQYFDGFGRSLQNVKVQSTPSKQNLVVPFDIDPLGRQQKEYLPFSIDGLPGKFIDNALSLQQQYYNAPPPGVPSSFAAYTESIFEAAPLNRVIGKIGPRDDAWNAIPKNKQFNELLMNVAGEITRWKDYTSGFPVKDGTYPANTLVIEQIIDESTNVSQTFRNTLGQVVLKRTGKGSVWLETFFIYSPSGLLKFAIEPEGVVRLATEYDAVGADKQSFLDRWTFQYQYDTHQNIIAKKIPGSAAGADGWNYTVFDQWDRVVLNQNPDQRTRNEYTFTKYDIFNRAVMTGLYASATPIATIRTEAKNSSVRYESPDNSETGYTLNNTYPFGLVESNLLTVSYYDNYNFMGGANWDRQSNDFTFVNLPGFLQNTEILSSVKGSITGSKIRVLDNDKKWLNKVIYYDKKLNEIQSITESHLSGVVRKTIAYDFSRNTVKEQNYYSQADLSIFLEFERDHAGRLIKVYNTLNSQPRILMYKNGYNEIGQVVERNIHSTDDGLTFLQSIDRRYNILL